jgi:hypothetical protein
MSASKIGERKSHADFWRVVVECLHEFHEVEPDDAERQARAIRKKMMRLPHKSARLLYHAEPFDVACDIAKRPLKLTKARLTRYLEIRDRAVPEDSSKRHSR